jgi:hypothetical protein
MNRVLSAFSLHVVILILPVSFCSAQAPPVQWARQLVSTNGANSWGSGAAIDQFGDNYVAGACGGCGVLAKCDSSGKMLWSVQTENSSLENLAVDPAGNAYIVGSFWNTATVGTNVFVIPWTDGTMKSFVAKVDTAGHFLWAQLLTGPGQVGASGIAVGTNGTSYVAGNYMGQEILGSTNTQYVGFVAAFGDEGALLWAIQTPEAETYCGLKSSGNVLVLGHQLLAEYNEFGYLYAVSPNQGDGSAACVGSDGSVCTAETTWGTNMFDGCTLLIRKYSPSRNLIWTTFATNAQPAAIAVDPSGSAYVCGYYSGSNSAFQGAPANFGGTSLPGSGSERAFAAKYDSSGRLQWVNGYGGAGDLWATGVAVAGSGTNVYLSGVFTSSANFGSCSLTTPTHGQQGLFLVNLGTGAIPQLSLRMFPGQTPGVTLSGMVSNTYQIEYADSLRSTWHPWLRFVLPSSPYTLFDPSPNPTARFYRAALVQP